ncbi:phage terminase Nu1 subunit (DNA packaging protein) [Clostridium saccharoperbutylacetonicum]|uniref:Uncharacterized protein n=1 Tax=Clostridium saccharoperbutylacetonicum N1-4(HMT) TaxID=931276 RepID=M1LTV7_9CLOT|nr:hypothetical protein [Clostridium saccharoperbutylacetonicum]AGF56480.1 hypothetical protein Cspa_c27150 [Clostridium saccharoperbutylacetonicum N1-4(HMT)]NRT62773.1 phage terminase Nu1 subunit (DNA packaging protein) [Clostridium saccharoperbutylacetonicum]NSB26125.1 phage terminase Nu1 subunit (DNA packaging protein) [Clostridium saccharoperbutylacetonicum]NSB45480.1 phage terminase Nu1 subunit (DNA packaging protein) [Clostridium saccharoperbutylacetonicum]
MIKALITILVKLVEAKLEKAGVETLILKNKNYITVAKQIWDMVDENFRISQSIEEKVSSKIDTFNLALLKEFPELKQDDIDKLRQSVAGSVNAGKQAVLDNSTILKQLQEKNDKLALENTDLKNKLANINAQSTVVNTVQETVA